MPDPWLLELPQPLDGGEAKVSASTGVVIVGANGAGKSRLGAWMEFSSPQSRLVHRVSAQKSLEMPPLASTSSLQSAEADLLYGYNQRRA